MLKLARFSLKSRMSIPIMSMVFLAVGAMVAYSSIMNSRAFESDAQQIAETLAKELAANVAKDLEAPATAMASYAAAFEAMKISGSLNRPNADAALIRLLEANPNFVATWTLWEPNMFDGKDSQYVNTPGTDASGRFIPYWNRGSGKIVLEPLVDYEKPGPGDYYLVPKATLAPSLIEPYEYPINGAKVLITSVVHPIMIDKVFYGVVGVDIPLLELQRMLSQIKPYENGYASLLSTQGNFSAHPDATFLMKNIGDTGEYKVVKEHIAAGKLFIHDTIDPKLGAVMEVFAPVKARSIATPWSLRVTISKEKILEKANHLLLMQILGGVLALIGLFTTVQLLAGSISRPIDQISQDLQKTAKTLDEQGQGLSRASQQVSESATEQAAAVQETVSSMTEMASMIAQTQKNTGEVLSMVQQINSRATEGRETMKQMASSMDSIHQSSLQLQAISKIIEEIHNKTAVINDIVLKTQLLSFNASIEAARAGVHGKGFAVVAEEVSNLAKLSGSASNEIKVLLGTSQAHVKEILEGTQARINEGRLVTNQALENFDTIVEEVEAITTQTQHVAEATREQELGIKQVSSAMTEMDAATRRSRLHAQDSAESASQLLSIGRNLIGIVQETRRLVEGHHDGRESSPASSSSGSAQTHSGDPRSAYPSHDKGDQSITAIAERLIEKQQGTGAGTGAGAGSKPDNPSASGAESNDGFRKVG